MQLKDYIKGNKRGKDANRLEREAMNDPFLLEALDGFEKTAGDHASIINLLEKKYSGRPDVPKRRKLALLPHKRMLLLWSAAASVLLFITGISVYILLEKKENTFSAYAELIPDKKENVVVADSEVPQTAQMEELRQEPLIAVAETKVVKPAPASKPRLKEDESAERKISENNLAAKEAITISDLREEQVTIEEKSEKSLFEENAKRMISRTVIDETTGLPAPFVYVAEKGTANRTQTDAHGVFNIELSGNDSAKLVVNLLGFKSQEINPNDTNKTVMLKPDLSMLEEVVVVGFGEQKRTNVIAASPIDAVSSVKIPDTPFGEKEFETYCKEKIAKNICIGKKASVKVSFIIDETGKPDKIEFKNYSCEEVKKEMENQLASSPVWTRKNRKVTMTIRW